MHFGSYFTASIFLVSNKMCLGPGLSQTSFHLSLIKTPPRRPEKQLFPRECFPVPLPSRRLFSLLQKGPGPPALPEALLQKAAVAGAKAKGVGPLLSLRGGRGSLFLFPFGPSCRLPIFPTRGRQGQHLQPRPVGTRPSSPFRP